VPDVLYFEVRDPALSRLAPSPHRVRRSDIELTGTRKRFWGGQAVPTYLPGYRQPAGTALGGVPGDDVDLNHDKAQLSAAGAWILVFPESASEVEQ
jgi:hypothetical protein